MKSNLILIGMPGVGKSTVGVLAAKLLAKKFVDTDLVIQERENASLSHLIRTHGVDGFCKMEERHILSLKLQNTVVATGGSAVYSSAAMQHLQSAGVIVHLELPCAELESRLDDLASRGVVIPPGVSLAELYREREPLYRRWGELTIDCRGKSQIQVAAELADSDVNNA